MMNGLPSSPSSSSYHSVSGRSVGHSDLLNDPEAFAREINRPSVTVETLLQHRQRVQAEADDINVALKRNVYKNYALFIDSAKMISLLKNEMYNLSRLLTDQQTLLSSLTDTSISGDRTHGLTLNEKKEVVAKYRNEVMTSSGTSTSTMSGTGTPSTLMSSSYSSDYLGTPSKSMSRSYTGSSITGTMTASTHNVNVTQNSIELNQVLDMIEGCAGILDTRHRILLHYGELVELDVNDYTRVPGQGKTLAVLLNDCLILALAFPFPSRMGKKYKFVSLFELDNIAVVNVKDSSVKNAFKVLMYPLMKVYDANSPDSKKKWLDCFDSAKKNRRASLSLQRRDSLLFGSAIDTVPATPGGVGTTSKGLLSPVERGSVAVYTFDEELEDVSESESEVIPLWLQEFPDDMDVFIAQRNFEDAVALVLKVNDHLILYPKCYDGFFQNDLKLRVNHKIQELVECISHELQTSPDRSLQAAPRSARRAVQLLLKLGKASLATQLFLQQRSSILKSSLPRPMSEGSAVPFIKRLTSVFFNNLIETSREFDKAFKTSASLLTPNTINVESAGNGGRDGGPSSQPASLTESLNGIDTKSPQSSFPPSYPMACLMVWCEGEVTKFIGTFCKHVFLPNVPLGITCESVSILRHQSNRLRNSLGLDLLSFIDKLIRSDILTTIRESREKLIDSLRTKVTEESWESLNLQSKPGVDKFFAEIKDSSLNQLLLSYVYDETKISLSSSVVSFSKGIVSYTSDSMKMSTPFTHKELVSAILQVIRSFIQLVEQSLRKEENQRSIKFIRRNASFLLDNLLPLVDGLYSDRMGSRLREITTIRNDFEHLKGESGTREPVVSSSDKSKKRSPSKSTISISEGKTFSTTTYL